MHCGDTFSSKQVKKMLTDSGLKPGTPEFSQAMTRQFMPAEGMPGRYVDNPSFDPGVEK